MSKTHEPQYAEFGRRLKIYRIERQIVILDLVAQLRTAGFTTYHQSHISDYENGRRKIPTEFLINLAEIGWDITRLFRELEVFPPFDYYTLGVSLRRLKINILNFPNPFDAGYKSKE